MNLIEKLGLEKCKQIVENHATCYMPRIFKYWSESLNDYVLAEKYATASVEAIRAAIANPEKCQHEWNEITSNGDKYRFFVCKHCDSARNFAHLEEDHCSDIKNHISPNTKVIEHE